MKNKIIVPIAYEKLEEDSRTTLKRTLYGVQQEEKSIESAFYNEDRLKNTVNLIVITRGLTEEKSLSKVGEVLKTINILGVEFGEPELQEKEEKENWFTHMTIKKGAIVALIGSILMALLAVFIVKVAEPAMENFKARQALEEVVNQRGVITPVNTSPVVFSGQTIENANIDQKALGSGGQATTPASYIFDNDKVGEKKNVDIFLDFSNQRSRDFLIFNREVLRGMVEGGNIQLRILPVPTGKSYTIYASEALAEAFVSYPDKAWDFMFDLALLYPNTDNSTAETIVESIANKAQESGMTDITVESIQSGTFASWIISIGNDSRLQTGYYPPLVYVDDKLLDIDNPNDTETLKNMILRGAN